MSESKPVSRMLNIMDVVSIHPSGATMLEITEQLQLPRSSTYRLVRSLVTEGYLQGEGRHSRYRLGQRFLRQYHNSALTKKLVNLVRPTLRHLCGQLEEVVNINSLVGWQIRPVCAEFPSAKLARAIIMPGDLFPVHASASGKVICAFQELALQEEMLIHNDMVCYRPNTITDQESLLSELADVKKQGFAIIDDELDEDVLAVAVPIAAGSAGVIYSLGMVAYRQRILENRSIPSIVKQLKQGAAEIAQILASSRLDGEG